MNGGAAGGTESPSQQPPVGGVAAVKAAPPARSWRDRLAGLLPPALTAGIAYIAGGEAINLLLSLASFVLTTRLLSKPAYGVWATILDAVLILLGLAAFGLPLASVQAVATRRGAQYVLPALLLRLVTTAAAAAVMLVVVAISRERDLYLVPGLLAAPGLIASGVTAACEEVLRARKQFSRAAALENVARAAQVLVVLAIAVIYRRGAIERPGVTVLIIAWSCTWMIGLATGLAWVRPAWKLWPSAWQGALHLSRTAPLLGAVTLTLLLRFRIEVVLLGVLRSSVEAAQFAVAARVYTIALVIPEIVVTVLFPYLLHARREGIEDLEGQVTRLFLLVMVAGALVSTALLLVAPVAVRLTAGSAYSQAAVPARWLALLIAPAYLSSVATILLVEQRRARAAAASLVMPAIAAYIVELALVGRFGEPVCILCGGGAVLLSCILELAAARRYGVLRLS